MIRVLAAALFLAGGFGCNGTSRAAMPSSVEATMPTATTAPAGNEGHHQTTSSALQRATLTIEGMVCQGCAEAAEQTLEKVAGVVSADTDFQSGTAIVSFDRDSTNVDALVAAIEGVERDPAPAFRVTGTHTR